MKLDIRCRSSSGCASPMPRVEVRFRREAKVAKKGEEIVTILFAALGKGLGKRLRKGFMEANNAG